MSCPYNAELKQAIIAVALKNRLQNLFDVLRRPLASPRRFGVQNVDVRSFFVSVRLKSLGEVRKERPIHTT